MSDFGFNRKAYEALPADLKRILDLAVASNQVHGNTEYHAKNAVALERLKTEYKGKVELDPVPGAGPARPQEGHGRRDPRAIRADAAGSQGQRVVRQIPGAARPVGRSGRSLVPPATQEVTERRLRA